MVKEIIVFLLIPISVCACSTTNYKIVNDSVPESSRKNTLLKDTGICKQQAYGSIQYSLPVTNTAKSPSQKYVFRNKYDQVVGSMTTEKQSQPTTVYDSFKKAQENSRIRSNSYEKRIDKYTTSCLRAKGWRKEILKGGEY